ncbi:hypothetical protein SCLCIDRAFT_1140514 [Scleroderma citrinum Foug A]|uniref:Uncharacterized protein n=1 Tax=Scleroderma citrinum Foug A TaxID=1036808 RepID=A0A0C2Z5R2_9AGAM|nr:hypothetical protein SCLCIDRAFT_1140514 [Scleroderma citrinum Foug A]
MKQCPRPFESCISEKRSATVTIFHCFRDYLLVRTTHPYVIMGRRAPGSQSMVPCTVVTALSEWAVEALMGSTNLGSADLRHRNRVNGRLIGQETPSLTKY